MLTYDTYGLALPGKVYSPSKTVTVPANDTAKLVFRGRDALAYGITAIFVAGEDPDALTYTGELEDGDKTLFRKNSERAIRDLFEGHGARLPSPIIIPKKRDFTLTVTNDSGGDLVARASLQGFVESQLAVVQEQQRENFGFVPEIRFIYGSVETNDGDTFQPMNVTIPPGNWIFNRVAIGVQDDSTANREGNSVRFRSGDYTVKQPVTIEQIRQQFRYGGTEGVQYVVDNFDPFDVEVSNDSGNTNTTDLLIPIIPGEAQAAHNDRNRVMAQF